MVRELLSWPGLVRHGGVLVKGRARGDAAGTWGAVWSRLPCAPRDGRVASRERRGDGRAAERARRVLSGWAIGTRRAREVWRGGDGNKRSFQGTDGRLREQTDILGNERKDGDRTQRPFLIGVSLGQLRGLRTSPRPARRAPRGWS